MSLYSLHTALEHVSTKQGRVSTLTAISVHQGGHYVTGSATAHLLSTSAGEHAVVFVPADAPLVNAPDRQADYTGDTGTRYYDFASHEAALAFLRSLYGIDQPSDVAQPSKRVTFRVSTDDLGHAHFFQVDGRESGYIDQRHDGSLEVFFRHMLDAPTGVPLERSTAPNSQGVYVLDVHTLDDAIALVRRTYSTASAPISPRSVPAPLARDVDLSCPASQHGMTDRASFLAHTATYQQPLTARNTQ